MATMWADTKYSNITGLSLYKLLKPENTAIYPQSNISVVILMGQMIGYYLSSLKTSVGFRKSIRHLEHDMNFLWCSEDKFSLYVLISIWKHNMALVSACAYVDMNIIYTEQGVTLTPDYDHSEKTDPCQEQHKYVTWAHNNELALTFCKAEWYCSGLCLW